MRRACLSLAAIFCLGNCGTIGSFVAGQGDGERSLIMGGVRIDALMIVHMFSGDKIHGVDVFWISALCIFDLPLSLAADLLTLPVTVGMEIFAPQPIEKEPARESKTP